MHKTFTKSDEDNKACLLRREKNNVNRAEHWESVDVFTEHRGASAMDQGSREEAIRVGTRPQVWGH